MKPRTDPFVKNIFAYAAVLLLLLTLNSRLSTVCAQGTAFTYQGRLNDGANPANGHYDLRFTLYDAATNGTSFGVLTNDAASVSNGLFTVLLDFGDVFNGSNYWLELAVRTNGGTAFSPLNPRQPVTPTPYAAYATTAGNAGSVAAANIVGTVPLAQLPANVVTNNETGVTLSGTFNGDGGGLTGLNASQLTGGAVPDTLLSSNVALVNDFFQNDFIAYPTTTSDMGLNIALTQPTGYSFYGTINTAFVPSAFTATNLQLYISAVTNNTPATLRLFVVYSLPAGNFTVSSLASAFTTNILVQSVPDGQTQDFPISLQIPGNVYVMASVITTATNQLLTAWYYQNSGNTNGARYPLWFASDTNTYGYYYPVSYSVAAISARIEGTQKVSILSGSSSASAITYSGASSGLSMTNVQAAIDGLVYSLNPAKTYVVVDGDSKSVGLYDLFTNNWFSQCSKTLIGVGGTSLAFAKLAWETNGAAYASQIHNGTNGVFILWSAHNDVQSINPYTEIQTLSNLLVEVVSSNYLPVVITTQPRSGYGSDLDSAHLFVKIINNYIRQEPMIWRVVDAEAIMPNNYDSRFFVDTTHLNSDGYSIIANEVARQIASPYKVNPPQSWIGLYGTNMVCSVPASNGPAVTLFTANSAGFINFNGSVTATRFTGNGAGLTNLPALAITGGVNTNMVISGHTFYVTNGLIMRVQ